mmetsp:Transcript_116275/g.329497  ORF Transcript_116275/g.329497 Transcript_116275/m.329497 type:complete len:210 (-) Transcript_116275:271-900(-)
MLFPLKSMRFHSSWSFLPSCMRALIFFSSSSKSLMDFFRITCSWVALWPMCVRRDLPQVSPETMSASKLACASGLTRVRMYAQNSTKRTCPPRFPSIFWNSCWASGPDRLSPSWLRPRWNSPRSMRRSAPVSMLPKTRKSLLNQKMLSSSAWNSFFSTQSSPSPSFRMVFLYARMSAGLLSSHCGQVPPFTSSTTILSISARLTTSFPL